jgi:hypothetical protein
MKWFKHYTEADTDPKLIDVRMKWGYEGVGWWWTVLSLVAQRYQEGRDPSLEIPTQELAHRLLTRPMRLRSYLSHLSLIGLLSATETDMKFTISIPNILKIKDNYQKDLEDSSKRLPSKEVDIDKEHIPPTPQRGKEWDNKPIPGIDPQPMTEEQQKEFNARMKKITDQMKGAFDD